MGFAESGAHAKEIVENEDVKVNGEIELRKRAKLRQGDIVKLFGEVITIE